MRTRITEFSSYRIIELNKQDLRIFIRNEKRRFTQEELREASLPIITALLAHPRVVAAEVVLCYHSLPDEVYTHQACDELVRMGKRVLLPKVVSDTEMTIHEYHDSRDLILGGFGILEPSTPPIDITTLPQSLVAIIPGMAFDRACHRLGRGKGYYDRLLSQLPYIYKIGVAFPFQLLDDIPCEPTDIQMDEVISI